MRLLIVYRFFCWASRRDTLYHPLLSPAVIQQRGVHFALLALGKHVGISKVVEAAASLLWSLGHYDDIELVALPPPSDVASALAKALRQHPDDSLAVHAIGGALWTLALPHSDFARGLCSAAASTTLLQPDLAALLPNLHAASANNRLSELARSHAESAAKALQRST